VGRDGAGGLGSGGGSGETRGGGGATKLELIDLKVSRKRKSAFQKKKKAPPKKSSYSLKKKIAEGGKTMYKNPINMPSVSGRASHFLERKKGGGTRAQISLYIIRERNITCEPSERVASSRRINSELSCLRGKKQSPCQCLLIRWGRCSGAQILWWEAHYKRGPFAREKGVHSKTGVVSF